jgi:hypothetical protein
MGLIKDDVSCSCLRFTQHRKAIAVFDAKASKRDLPLVKVQFGGSVKDERSPGTLVKQLFRHPIKFPVWRVGLWLEITDKVSNAVYNATSQANVGIHLARLPQNRQPIAAR